MCTGNFYLLIASRSCADSTLSLSFEVKPVMHFLMFSFFRVSNFAFALISSNAPKKISFLSKYRSMLSEYGVICSGGSSNFFGYSSSSYCSRSFRNFEAIGDSTDWSTGAAMKVNISTLSCSCVEPAVPEPVFSANAALIADTWCSSSGPQRSLRLF